MSWLPALEAPFFNDFLEDLEFIENER